MSYMNGQPCCDMEAGCTQPIEYIDIKGWIYCGPHGRRRKHSGIPSRKLRPWEMRLLEAKKPLPSYQPISQREALRREQERAQ